MELIVVSVEKTFGMLNVLGGGSTLSDTHSAIIFGIYALCHL